MLMIGALIISVFIIGAQYLYGNMASEFSFDNSTANQLSLLDQSEDIYEMSHLMQNQTLTPPSGEATVIEMLFQGGYFALQTLATAASLPLVLNNLIDAIFIIFGIPIIIANIIKGAVLLLVIFSVLRGLGVLNQ